MAKPKITYACQSCGYITHKWLGRCPECGDWDSLVEEVEREEKSAGKSRGLTTSQKAMPLSQISLEHEERMTSGIGEFDLVLGGGIVTGSLVLVGGDPGIGKSTILLQVARHVTAMGKTVLYVSGEESIKQLKLRAQRLAAEGEKLFVISENNLEAISAAVTSLAPDLLIVDSIQTVFNPEITSAPGTVSQVRDATLTLMNLAKGKGIPTFIVGHVTKSGSLAGPKVLEHMVDTVLYFEGERHNVYRILRSVKNRFGSTNEIGLFEMTSYGLEEVKNPSEIFISHLGERYPGSVITASLEGTRPVLVEIQSLVSSTNFNNPRRMSVGYDHNKMVMMMAILEKKIGMALYDQDAYINVVGGMTLTEPATDLSILCAITSSYRNKPIDPHTLVFGEVGLTGEVRGVTHAEKRIREGQKLGFKRCILPKKNLEKLPPFEGIELIGVDQIRQVFDELF